jgi:hypothetical protein
VQWTRQEPNFGGDEPKAAPEAERLVWEQNGLLVCALELGQNDFGYVLMKVLARCAHFA